MLRVGSSMGTCGLDVHVTVLLAVCHEGRAITGYSQLLCNVITDQGIHSDCNTGGMVAAMLLAV